MVLCNSITTYLDEVCSHLPNLPASARHDIRRELLAHLADAAEAGGFDITLPTVQTMLLERLGRSGQLGIAFARSYQPQQGETMQRWIPFAIALGAFGSAASCILGLMLGDQSALATTLLTIAPFCLAPLMVGMFRAQQKIAPAASLLALICGIVGISAFILPLSGTAFAAIASLVGIWFWASSGIGWRTNTLPGSLAVLGFLLGAGWLARFGGLILDGYTFQSPHLIAAWYPIETVSLLLGYLAWAGWLTYRVWQQSEATHRVTA